MPFTDSLVIPGPLLVAVGALLVVWNIINYRRRWTNEGQYPTFRMIYNIYFHPLAHIPGPRSWAASRLHFVYALIKGTIVHDFERLHREYGPILRIAPDEVTFAKAEAWVDIFQGRPGHQYVNLDKKEHSRVRSHSSMHCANSGSSYPGSS
jgi:hypothetical protein